MGVYYRWVCDEKKEYFDPGDLLGPRVAGGYGYGIKAGSIPHSAWVVGVLCTGRWYGCSVRLVGDGGGDYDCEGYEDVHQGVLRGLDHQTPVEGLRFLVGELRRATGKDDLRDRSPNDWVEEAEESRRDEYLKILHDHAREDWPATCKREDCLHRGERHDGDCVADPPLTESRSRRRQYALGLGRVEVDPGEEGVLGAEATCDFRADRLHFDDGAKFFELVRVSVAGVEQGRIVVVKPGQKVEVVVLNVSSTRATLAAAVMGTIEEFMEGSVA